MIAPTGARQPPSPSRLSRWAGRLAAFSLGALGLDWLLHTGVAAAIALAPNAPLPWKRPSHSFSPPPALTQRKVLPFRVPLGDAPGELASWIVEPPAGAAKATIVLLHGVRMDKRSLLPMALAVSDAGYRAVLVDLRGHGESGGSFLTYGAADATDVSRLLDGLQAHGTPLGPVGVYGFSYGAAAAIDLAARDARVASVVAVSPFCSLREVIGDYRRKYLPGLLQIVPDDWFQSAVDDAGIWAGFDADGSAPQRNIEKSRADVLLIHGDADTQVPLRHSQVLARASAGRAKLAVIPGATHDSMPVDATRAIRDRAVAWFDDSLGASSH